MNYSRNSELLSELADELERLEVEQAEDCDAIDAIEETMPKSPPASYADSSILDAYYTDADQSQQLSISSRSSEHVENQPKDVVSEAGMEELVHALRQLEYVQNRYPELMHDPELKHLHHQLQQHMHRTRQHYLSEQEKTENQAHEMDLLLEELACYATESRGDARHARELVQKLRRFESPHMKRLLVDILDDVWEQLETEHSYRDDRDSSNNVVETIESAIQFNLDASLEEQQLISTHNVKNQ